MAILLNTEKTPCIGRGHFGQFFRVFLQHIGQFQEYGFNKSRFITPGLVFLRGRGQIGGVGFDEQAVQGDVG